MNVTAKFMGEDGSLGYRRGEIYRLRLRVVGNRVIITFPNRCPYNSLYAFQKNWKVLS